MNLQIFTTDQIARVLHVPEWRIVRFAQIKQYGITPAFGDAKGSGSRRLYSLENVCQMALASWLAEAGLRVELIGRVLERVTRKGGLSRFVESKKYTDWYLGVVRAPKGKKVRQDAVYIDDWKQLTNIFEYSTHTSVLVIPIGMNFAVLRNLIEQTGD